MLFRLARVLLLLLAAACGRERAWPAAALRDDLGQPIALAGAARRIVSLSPSTTELLFAIGAGDRVVGRTRWCDYPPAATAVPSVGDGLDPNVEAVLARHPDLVVFYASSANAGAIARLGGLGIATASMRLDRLDDLPRAARLLGWLTATTRRADSMADRFQGGLDSARAAHPAVARRAAVIVWDNPPIIIGGGSFLTELLTLAGVRNVFADVAQPSAPTSLEALAARDPDVLLLLGSAPPPTLARPEWRALRAIRARRIVIVQGSEFERPSLRSFAAVHELERAVARAGGAP